MLVVFNVLGLSLSLRKRGAFKNANTSGSSGVQEKNGIGALKKVISSSFFFFFFFNSNILLAFVRDKEIKKKMS